VVTVSNLVYVKNQRLGLGRSLAYLSVRKWLVWVVDFHVKIWQILTQPPCTLPIFNLFSLVVPQP